MRQFWEKIVSLAGSNLGLKALALIIAVGLWLAGHRDIERALEVPVEFRNIPQDLMVVDNRVDFVILRLSGPRTLVSTIDSDDLKLSIDLNGAKPGVASYPLSSGSFSIPRGVGVARITPPVVHLRLEPVLKRKLPVNIRLSGKPAVGYTVVRLTAEPDLISVQGPAEDLRRLTAAETVPIDIEGVKGSVKRRVRLAADGKQLTFLPEQVDISLAIEAEDISRDFPHVEIQTKGFNGVYEANPKFVDVKIAGPKNLLDGLESAAVQVYLNLNGLSTGEHNLPLSFSLPPGITVLEHKPQRIRVRIVKPGK